MKSTILYALFASGLGATLALTGCSGPNDGLSGGDEDPGALGPGGANADGTNGTNTTTAPLCADVGGKYVGFGDSQLEASRVDGAVGVDRARVKPYSALQTEYQRVLGTQPTNLAGAAATFGQPPARWFLEPEASAVSLYTAFSVAFDGCLTYTATPAQYAVAPAADTAKTECTSMIRKFWSREATPDELTACTNVAVNDTTKETDAKRRWAYTCASVMTAAGFLTF